jgi:hypothetical protein
MNARARVGRSQTGDDVVTLLPDATRSTSPDRIPAGPRLDLRPGIACRGPQDGETVRPWARDHAGRIAMEATAQLPQARA